MSAVAFTMVGIGGILLVSAVALGTVMRVQATRQLVEKLAGLP